MAAPPHAGFLADVQPAPGLNRWRVSDWDAAFLAAGLVDARRRLRLGKLGLLVANGSMVVYALAAHHPWLLLGPLLALIAFRLRTASPMAWGCCSVGCSYLSVLF